MGLRRKSLSKPKVRSLEAISPRRLKAETVSNEKSSPAIKLYLFSGHNVLTKKKTNLDTKANRATIKITLLDQR